MKAVTRPLLVIALLVLAFIQLSGGVQSSIMLVPPMPPILPIPPIPPIPPMPPLVPHALNPSILPALPAFAGGSWLLPVVLLCVLAAIVMWQGNTGHNNRSRE